MKPSDTTINYKCDDAHNGTTEEHDLRAELYAADVVTQLGKIAAAQHRISIAICSDQREAVLRNLKELGVASAAVDQFNKLSLRRDEYDTVLRALKAIEGWRPHLTEKLRAFVLAGK